MARKRWHQLLSPIFGLATLSFALASSSGPQVQFEGQVESILRAHCGSCHSGKAPKAGLDLTTAKSILKGGRSGPAAISKNSIKSLLVIRLLGTDGNSVMPLGFKPLNPDKINLIKKWIDDGCISTGKETKHWAYVAPKMPQIPKIEGDSWSRNDIDRFVLLKMKANKLKPSAPASKSTLVRRLYLDLTGLPPSVDQAKKFCESNDPQVYEKLVDELLASRHFGERMARPWLDLTRYADSDGYEKDLNRSAWKYRDWLIEAFNKNMPYDEFSIEQIAGDLLPDATIDQKIATGFHRNSMFNSEGGVDPKEAYFNVVIDRINTTSTVFLGSTMACARCHDHKYDPFTQRDFYRMYAFLANTDYEKQGDHNSGEEKWYEPNIEVPTREQTQELNRLQRAIDQSSKELKNCSEGVKKEFESWLQSESSSKLWVAPTIKVKTKSGMEFTRIDDGSMIAAGAPPENDIYTISIPEQSSPITGIKITAIPDSSFVNYGPGKSVSGNFILTGASLNSNALPIGLLRADASYSQSGYQPSNLINQAKSDAWAVYGAVGQKSSLLLVPKNPIPSGQGATLNLRFESDMWKQHIIGRFKIEVTSAQNPRIYSNSIQKLLDSSNLDAQQRDALLIEFQKFNPSTAPIFARYMKAIEDLKNVKSSIATAPIIVEKPNLKALVANIHIRGEFGQVGDPVQAGPPEFLSLASSSENFNRLSFAKWLFVPGQPLTARVQVNRLWEMIFSKGLVETSEDFGTQGSAPSHPELLDYLALSFEKSGWDNKSIIKKMVMSATYQQSSGSNPTKNQIDPQNRWLSRAPRYRMEAEMIRDNMLSISGLLSTKIGGPSVFPDQPEGVWDTPYNGQKWMTSSLGEKYRRGIYTFWKRSAPYPSFAALDATSRETCTVRRMRTNTPLQALALLNDEVTINASQSLAKKVTSKERTWNARIFLAFQSCTLRKPSVAEMQRLEALFQRLVSKYKTSPDLAKKLGSEPEMAALILVCNTIFNLDETLSRS